MAEKKGFRIPTEDESMTVGFLMGRMTNQQIADVLVERHGYTKEDSLKAVEYVMNLTEESQE